MIERFWSFWPLWLYLIFGLAVVMIYLAWFFGDLKKIWCWLKGSRKTYYFSAGKREIYHTSLPCRNSNDRKYIDGSVIEMSGGLFHRRSAIYGSATSDWHIARDWFDPILDPLHGDRVALTDNYGLPIVKAVHVINTYSSLQAMLGRIDKLEKELKESERQRKKRWAGVKTILTLINLDRNKYRSQTSERIRKWLEIVNRPEEFSEEAELPDVYIENWMFKLSSETPAEKV